MKKILPTIVFLWLLSFLFSYSVSADFERSYQYYIDQYNQYRNDLTKFLTAKNRYLTYDTLTSQTEALTATKNFIISRDQTIILYLLMLLEKDIANNNRKLIESDILFYTDHKNLVPATASLDDSFKIADDFTNHYPQTYIIAKKTIANLLISKIRGFDDKLSNINNEIDLNINLIKDEGKDVSTIERWLLETKNKQILSQEKINQAEVLSNGFKSQSSNLNSEDLNNVLMLIQEANQYLKEAVNYQKEIVDELKYGNY
ncbi:MAG: hypothetical protein V1858_01905 [Candidatus Gottesmanbacteria bacterium]